jgi:SAM-dependent methyltransferase
VATWTRTGPRGPQHQPPDDSGHMSVIWHDLECGRYEADLPFWRALAAAHDGPILDIGAGTGRVALDLAHAGHDVTALDTDAELLSELERRGRGLKVSTVIADARDFHLDSRFGLCLVPMQTVQLLGGAANRRAFLDCAREHLLPGGRIAVALAAELDEFEVVEGGPAPLPDVCELDGIVYSSAPTAVRADGGGFILERRREMVTRDGDLSSESDRIHLDRVEPRQFEDEARAAGYTPAPRGEIAATRDYVGSVVVVLDV